MGGTSSTELEARLVEGHELVPPLFQILVIVPVHDFWDTVRQLTESDVDKTTFNSSVRSIFLGVSFLKNLRP